MTNQANEQTEGCAAAAFVAAGIGCFALGVTTCLSESIKAVENAFNWYNPVGALTGKTWIAIFVWVISWAILGSMWKNRTMAVGTVVKVTYVLIALGILGTFPEFFDLL